MLRTHSGAGKTPTNCAFFFEKAYIAFTFAAASAAKGSLKEIVRVQAQKFCRER